MQEVTIFRQAVKIFDRIRTDNCKFLPEAIVGAQDYILLLNFSKWGVQLQILHFWTKIL